MVDEQFQRVQDSELEGELKAGFRFEKRLVDKDEKGVLFGRKLGEESWAVVLWEIKRYEQATTKKACFHWCL